jgi:hypothetical protein
MFKSKSSVSSRSTFSAEDDNSCNFDKWNIPKLSTKKIYTTCWLKSVFKAERDIKTVEKTFAITSNNEKYELFDKKVINDALVKGYKFLHIGAVQIAVKPLAKLDTNASVMLCLRDARFIDFQTSTLGMMQSSLFNGPIYFNIFPNELLSLTDVHITKALTLNVLTSGCDMEEGRRPLAVMYRIYYKLLKDKLNPHAVIKSSGNSAMLIQSSTQDAKIYVPKMIQRNEIDSPKEWILENVCEPGIVEETTYPGCNIQQNLDGSVKIRFF